MRFMELSQKTMTTSPSPSSEASCSSPETMASPPSPVKQTTLRSRSSMPAVIAPGSAKPMDDNPFDIITPPGA